MSGAGLESLRQADGERSADCYQFILLYRSLVNNIPQHNVYLRSRDAELKKLA